jgi:hypothetical protein
VAHWTRTRAFYGAWLSPLSSSFDRAVYGRGSGLRRSHRPGFEAVAADGGVGASLGQVLEAFKMGLTLYELATYIQGATMTVPLVRCSALPSAMAARWP